MNKRGLIKIFVAILIAVLLSNSSYANVSFNSFEKKQTSYLEFLLLKLENKLINRAQILQNQHYATRVQYSNVGIDVNYIKTENKVLIEITAIMDKYRYSKKRYKQKLSDCNVVRNLIFYQKYGYKFFTQKRDPILSEGIMRDTFKKIFLNNLTVSKKEMEFLINNMFVRVNVIHPVDKTKLTCSGGITDYELQ